MTFDDGLFSAPRSNLRIGMFDIARAIETEHDAAAGTAQAAAQPRRRFVGRIPAYPTGSAVCEVEIDPDTGVVEIVRYTSVDDAGQVINPMILHGQTHGGIVQGAGQALIGGRRARSRQRTGVERELHGLCHAARRHGAELQHRTGRRSDRTDNELRVKGGGEAGITPALATIMNAVVDALSVYGIDDFEMPATPARVWSAIQAAKRKSSARKPPVRILAMKLNFEALRSHTQNCGGDDVATFVLVHGAWHGGWCWRRVSEIADRARAMTFLRRR